MAWKATTLQVSTCKVFPVLQKIDERKCIFCSENKICDSNVRKLVQNDIIQKSSPSDFRITRIYNPYFEKILRNIIYLDLKFGNWKILKLLDNYSAAIYRVLNYYSTTCEILVESFGVIRKCYFCLHIFFRFQILPHKKLICSQKFRKTKLFGNVNP